MKITVLVTSAGALPAVSVIKALRAQNEIPVRIVTCDMDRLASGALLGEVFVQVPAARRRGYIPAVLRLCKRHKVRWIFPVMDEELLQFARSKERFRKSGIGVIVNNPDTIKLATDKWKAYRFCKTQGIRTPRTWRVSGLGAKPPGRFPIILKPRQGRGSVGMVRAANSAEFQVFKPGARNGLAQEHIKGREYTVDLIVQPDGKILQAVPRERLVTKAGVSYKGITRQMPRLAKFARDAARAFGVDGPANVQCMERGGKFYFLELNPKFGTGLSLTVAAGVNVPLVQLKLAMRRAVRPRDLHFKNYLVMLRYWEEVFTTHRSGRP